MDNHTKTDGMTCPDCGHGFSYVIDSRPAKEAIRRRRRCMECGSRWTTHEMVIKGDWYLGTPYSKYPGGIEEAFICACRQAAFLVRAGIPVYSPIAHTHPIAVYGGIDPLDHRIWLPADRPKMDQSRGLIICKMPTWGQSDGIQHEKATFRAAGKPVIYMTPGEVPAKLRSAS